MPAPATTGYRGKSAVPGCGVPGFMTPGLGYLPAPLRQISVKVYDPDMVQVGECALFESLTVTQNWYTPGTWELKINRYLPNAEYFEPGGFVEIPLDANLPGVRPFFGMIESFAPTLDKTGKPSEIWAVSGRSALAGKVRDRPCINRFNSGTGSDTQSSVAYETAIRHIVTENMVAAIGASGSRDTGRDIPGITLETLDLERGGTATALTTRGDKLLDILEQWCKASGLSVDLVHGAGDNWVFTVLEGVDRSGAGIAPAVILSVDLRNVNGYDYQYSTAAAGTVLICGGSGDGASRLVAEVYEGDTRPTGNDRFEIFVDLSDCTTLDELTTKGKEQLETYKPTQALTFTYSPEATSYVLDRDFSLGDTVAINEPGIVGESARILSIARTWGSDSYDVKITVGTEKPDMSSIIKKMNWSTKAARMH